MKPTEGRKRIMSNSENAKRRIPARDVSNKKW
jgi:hypothetical protein